VKQAHTFYRIPADVLGEGPFWTVVAEEAALLRAEGRDYFDLPAWRRLLVAANHSTLPEWALVALGRVRQRARTGASIAGFPGSVSPGWRR